MAMPQMSIDAHQFPRGDQIIISEFDRQDRFHYFKLQGAFGDFRILAEDAGPAMRKAQCARKKCCLNGGP